MSKVPLFRVVKVAVVGANQAPVRHPVKSNLVRRLALKLQRELEERNAMAVESFNPDQVVSYLVEPAG